MLLNGVNVITLVTDFAVSGQLAPLIIGSLHLEAEIFLALLLPTMTTFLVSHLHAL